MKWEVYKQEDSIIARPKCKCGKNSICSHIPISMDINLWNAIAIIKQIKKELK